MFLLEASLQVNYIVLSYVALTFYCVLILLKVINEIMNVHAEIILPSK